MLSIHLRCPHHPRYDPARKGEAGIKGGCIWCRKLLDLFIDARALEEEMDRMDWRRSIERIGARVLEA